MVAAATEESPNVYLESTVTIKSDNEGIEAAKEMSSEAEAVAEASEMQMRKAGNQLWLLPRPPLAFRSAHQEIRQ